VTLNPDVCGFCGDGEAGGTIRFTCVNCERPTHEDCEEDFRVEPNPHGLCIVCEVHGRVRTRDFKHVPGERQRFYLSDMATLINRHIFAFRTYFAGPGPKPLRAGGELLRLQERSEWARPVGGSGGPDAKLLSASQSPHRESDATGGRNAAQDLHRATVLPELRATGSPVRPERLPSQTRRSSAAPDAAELWPGRPSGTSGATMARLGKQWGADESATAHQDQGLSRGGFDPLSGAYGATGPGRVGGSRGIPSGAASLDELLKQTADKVCICQTTL
jgi:hypothetical protein